MAIKAINQCLAVECDGFLRRVSLFNLEPAFCPVQFLLAYIHVTLEVSTRRPSLLAVEISILGEMFPSETEHQKLSRRAAIRSAHFPSFATIPSSQ